MKTYRTAVRATSESTGEVSRPSESPAELMRRISDAIDRTPGLALLLRTLTVDDLPEVDRICADAVARGLGTPRDAREFTEGLTVLMRSPALGDVLLHTAESSA